MQCAVALNPAHHYHQYTPTTTSTAITTTTATYLLHSKSNLFRFNSFPKH